jgi:hypothetical protein
MEARPVIILSIHYKESGKSTTAEITYDGPLVSYIIYDVC